MRILGSRRLHRQLAVGLLVLGAAFVVRALTSFDAQEVAPPEYTPETVNAAVEQLREDFSRDRDPERQLRSSPERSAARQRANERLAALDEENEQILAGRTGLGVEKHVDAERRASARRGVPDLDEQVILEGLAQLRPIRTE